MRLNLGEEIYYKLVDETMKYKATVVASDTDSIVLRSNNMPNVKIGQFLVLIVEEGYHYTEVMEVKDQTIVIKPMFSERRQYFRVDDIFPIVIRKVDSEFALKEAKLLHSYQYDVELPDVDLKDETINPALWKMFLNINKKLGMIMEQLNLVCDDTLISTKIKPSKVNLSASGIRLTVNEEFQKDDIVEIKMLLPTHPPTGILAYGKVVRVEAIGSGTFEIAINFIHMNDIVREEIICYTINRQREIIRKHKSESGN